MLEQLFQQSVELSIWLQSLGDWLTPIMRAFTFLGNEEFFLLIMPVIVWSVDYTFGLRLGMMLLISGGINSTLKLAFHQPRPYWYDARVQNLTSPATDFGVPSGHSQVPLSVFGLIAATLKRGWVTALVVFVVFMIGLSRIYLGVHMYIDVLAGWTIGLLVLWAFLKLEGKVSAWFKSKSFGVKVGTVFLLTILLTLIGAGIVAANGQYTLPHDWVVNAHNAHPEEDINPFSLDGLISKTGALFGLAVGAFWLADKGGFNASSGAWWQRMLRFLIGLVGVVILWQGLGSVFPRGAELLPYALRYFRYTLVGLWVTGLAPWLFVRMGLGKVEG